MKINRLKEILDKAIAEGKGDYDVYKIVEDNAACADIFIHEEEMEFDDKEREFWL